MKKFFSVLLLTAAAFLFTSCGTGEKGSKYYIEYLNKDKTGIVQAEYEPVAEDTDGLINEFLAALCSDPDDVDYRKPIPNDVEITKYSLDGALLTLYFDADYLKMNEVEEVLCRAAIVRTMTQINGVDCLSFYVDEKSLTDANGKIIGTMYADSFVENPGEQINSSQKATLKLYFSNKAGTRLVPETREVHYSSNISLEKLVMEQLIEGPRKSGLLATIPSETKLITITVVDGVCYVNLDEMFLNQNQEISEPVVLYSIVDSLTELTGIDKVQISINGDTSGKCRYTYKLSKMYKADDRLVTKESDEKVESTE